MHENMAKKKEGLVQVTAPKYSNKYNDRNQLVQINFEKY